MKNTKTTIRELSARYRDILKKCFFLNAVALGLFAATSASADTTINVLPSTDDNAVQIYTKAGIDTTLADYQTALISAVRADAVKDKVAPAEAPATGNPADHMTDATYGFKDAAGVDKVGNDLASAKIADYTNKDSSATGVVRVGTGYKLSYNSGTYDKELDKRLLNASDYEYKDGEDAWTTYGAGEKTYTDTYKLGEFVAEEKRNVTVTGTVDPTTYELDGTMYLFAVGTTQYTLNADGTKVVNVATQDETLITSLPDGHLKDDALAVQGSYNTDKAAIQAKQDVVDGKKLLEHNRYEAATTVFTNDQTLVNNLATYEKSFEDATSKLSKDTTAYGNYTTYNNYATSLSGIMDGKVEAVVGHAADAVTDPENPVAATGLFKNVEDLQAAVGEANTAAAEDPSNATGLFKDVENLQAADTAINAKIGDLNDTRWGDDKTVGEVVKNIADIIGSKAESETWEGTFDGDKSVMSAVLDNKTAIGNEETRAKNAEAALDAKIGTIAADGTYVKAYVAATTEDPAVGTVAQNLVALDTAVAKLNGDDTVTDSVLYSVKQTAQNAVYNKETSYAAGTIGAAIKGNTTEIAAINTKLGTEDVDTTGNMAPTSGSVQTVIGGLNKLDDALTTERTARTDADAAINAKIGGSFDSTNTVAKAISDETTRATGVEAAINAKIGEGFDADNTVAQAIADLKQDTSDTFDDVVGTTGELADLESLSFFKAKNSGSVGGTAPGDSSVAELLTNLNGNLESEFARVDSRINKLETKLEKGLAANNALAGLVPLDHVHRTQVSAALGGYKNNQALAVGAFHYINDRTLLNAGAAYGGNDSVSYKVGVTFGF